MSYKVAAIIVVLQVRDNVVAFKEKKAAKREKRPGRGGGGSNRTTAVRLHSVERGGGRGDRGQWLVQGLRFELKFDAAPRRRFLP